MYRFINARRRIVQPMIDQSNRAGKSVSNLGEDLDGQSQSHPGLPERSCSTMPIRPNQSKPVRDSPQNRKKLHRRTSIIENPSAVSVIPPPLPLSYMPQGKIV